MRVRFVPLVYLFVTALWTAGALPAGADPVFQWHDLHDGGALQNDLGTAALTDDAGNMVIGGTSADSEAGIDLLVRKLDRESGDTLWTRRVPAVDGNDMALGGMVWDNAGDLLIGGTRLGCAT
jgi:hypothetical protein